MIFRFHRNPKRNLGVVTELPVSTYLLKITPQVLEKRGTYVVSLRVTLSLLLLMGTIFSYFCMSSITSVLILAILIAIVLF